MTSVRASDRGFLVELGDRTYEAEQVVIATGPFQVPSVPAPAAGLSSDVVQMHSSRYRSPADLPSGTVLVVGGGNTGFQIAAELVRSRDVHLAVGERQTPLGYRLDHSFVELPVFADDGRLGAAGLGRGRRAVHRAADRRRRPSAGRRRLGADALRPVRRVSAAGL